MTRRELIEYVQVHFEEGDNDSRFLEQEVEAQFVKPMRPSNPDDMDLEIWRQECKEFTQSQKIFEKTYSRHMESFTVSVVIH